MLQHCYAFEMLLPQRPLLRSKYRGRAVARRWHRAVPTSAALGRALQMAEELADHLGLGNGGDYPQRPLTAKRKVARIPPPTQWRKTGSHIQSKHASQQSCPAPVRCP